MSVDASAPYLFVKHTEGWNVDRCTRWMQAASIPVEFFYPLSGKPFPDPSRYAGVVVFGGRWSANDAHAEDWVLPEQRFIERCLHADTPYFGVCLGAQMLAHVCGARVAAREDGVGEVGFHRVSPSADGKHFLAAPIHVMQWHAEGFDLPAGAVRTATGELFPNQAFELSERTVAVQFHPEVNPEVLAIWQARNRERKPHDLCDAQRARHMADAVRNDAAITAWMDTFLSGWTRRAAYAACGGVSLRA